MYMPSRSSYWKLVRRDDGHHSSHLPEASNYLINLLFQAEEEKNYLTDFRHFWFLPAEQTEEEMGVNCYSGHAMLRSLALALGPAPPSFPCRPLRLSQILKSGVATRCYWQPFLLQRDLSASVPCLFLGPQGLGLCLGRLVAALYFLLRSRYSQHCHCSILASQRSLAAPH